MKEHLRQLAVQADNDIARGCLVREYLQARVLESLQEPCTFVTMTRPPCWRENSMPS